MILQDMLIMQDMSQLFNTQPKIVGFSPLHHVAKFLCVYCQSDMSCEHVRLLLFCFFIVFSSKTQLFYF